MYHRSCCCDDTQRQLAEAASHTVTQEAVERKQDVHEFASDVERQLRARTAATSAALAAMLQDIDAARRASAKASGPPDAVSRVAELEAGDNADDLVQVKGFLDHSNIRWLFARRVHHQAVALAALLTMPTQQRIIATSQIPPAQSASG